MKTDQKLDETERLTIQYYDENADWCYSVHAPTPWINETWGRTFMPSEPRLLDIGCGFGRYIPAFQKLGVSESNYVGIDPAARVLEIARKEYPGFDFKEMDLYSLPDNFPPGRFNIFASMLTLAHVTPHKMPRALDTIRKVMTDTGVGLIIMRETNQPVRTFNGVPQSHTYRGPAATFAGYTFDRLEPKLHSSGFRVRLHRPHIEGNYMVLVECM